MRLIFHLFSLFFGAFLLFIGNGLFLTASSATLSKLGINNITTGAINSGYFLGAVFSGIAAHRIISRVGHIRAFAFFAAIIGAGILFHVVSQNLWVWTLFRVLQGFSYYGILMIIESWLNEKSPTYMRSRVLAVYEFTFYLAFAIGAILMGLDLQNTDVFSFSTIFILLAILPLILTRIREPRLPPKKKINFPRVLGITPLALLGTFIAGILLNGFYTMSSIYILEQGFSQKEASWFLFSALAGAFCIQIPIGKFSDTYGRRLAIILMSGLTAISAIVIYCLGNNIKISYIFSFTMGSGMFTLYALSIARANDRLHTQENKYTETSTIELSRGLLFSYGFGALIAPLLMGIMMQLMGAKGFIVIYIIGAGILFLFSLFREPIPREQRLHFVHISSNASELLSALDPRSDKMIIRSTLAKLRFKKNKNSPNDKNETDIVSEEK